LRVAVSKPGGDLQDDPEAKHRLLARLGTQPVPVFGEAPQSRGSSDRIIRRDGIDVREVCPRNLVHTAPDVADLDARAVEVKYDSGSVVGENHVTNGQ
jgi:hypothetical protein